MPNTATRLINLILLLQRQPNQKAADLARELGVSVRTLHRYFAMLDELGIPVYSERGPHGGFSLVRGYRMPPLVFTPEEAVTLYLGASLVAEVWGRIYQEAAQGASIKLENVLPDEQRREIAWARRSLLATGMHRSDLQDLTPLLEQLRQAAREQRQVSMVYQSRNQPQPARRNLDPYALVHRWGWWYVVGFCHLRQAERTFRVDRIQYLSVLETTFELPAHFDLQSYLESEPQIQPAMTARLHFAPEVARLVAENRADWDTVEPQPDGSLIVSYPAPSLEWATSTALAYGPAVEALEPPELRQMVAQWAALVVEKYTNPTE